MIALKVRPRICIVICEIGWTIFTYISPTYAFRPSTPGTDTIDPWQIRTSRRNDFPADVCFPLHDRIFRISIFADHYLPAWMLVYENGTGQTSGYLAHYRVLWPGHFWYDPR